MADDRSIDAVGRAGRKKVVAVCERRRTIAVVRASLVRTIIIGNGSYTVSVALHVAKRLGRAARGASRRVNKNTFDARFYDLDVGRSRVSFALDLSHFNGDE